MGNILWLASYPKSGNTWMRVFIENYLSGDSKPVNINQMHKNSIDEVKAHWYQPYAGAGLGTMDLSTEEICQTLDVSRSTLYRYVGPNGEMRR